MHTLATYQCRTNYLKCSFFPQTIVAWNALTKSVVTSSTLDAFKAAHQPFLFLVLQPILTQLLSFSFTFLLSFILLLSTVFFFFTNIIYHVMRTDTCNKPHTLRDAVTGRNRNRIHRETNVEKANTMLMAM